MKTKEQLINLKKSSPQHQHKLLTILLTARTFGALLKVGMRGHQLFKWATAAVGYLSGRALIVLRWDSKAEGEVSLMLEY